MTEELFMVGDVIEITNADRPAWVKGKWRVRLVSGARVRLTPLRDDLSVDEQRDKSREYWIGA